MSLRIAEDAGGVEFAVKIVPGASRTAVAGLLGDQLKITVAAPPERGKANEALVVFLEEICGVRKGQVRILAGHTQPRKRVRVDGVTAAALEHRLTV